MEFIGERGSVITRNAHDRFELWGAHPEFEPIECQFPKPWHPRSSMVDARAWETANLLEEGEEQICPGEFGREALETVIALRGSHRRGKYPGGFAATGPVFADGVDGSPDRSASGVFRWTSPVIQVNRNHPDASSPSFNFQSGNEISNLRSGA